MVTIVDYTVLNNWNLLREYNRSILIKTNMWDDECVNLIVGILSWCISLSNNLTLNYHNFTCHLSIYFNKTKKEKETTKETLSMQSLPTSKLATKKIESKYQMPFHENKI